MYRNIKMRQSEIEAWERHEENQINEMLDKARGMKLSDDPATVAEGIEMEKEALHEYGVKILGVEQSHSPSSGTCGASCAY